MMNQLVKNGAVKRKDYEAVERSFRNKMLNVKDEMPDPKYKKKE